MPRKNETSATGLHCSIDVNAYCAPRIGRYWQAYSVGCKRPIGSGGGHCALRRIVDLGVVVGGWWRNISIRQEGEGVGRRECTWVRLRGPLAAVSTNCQDMLHTVKNRTQVHFETSLGGRSVY